MALPQHGQRHTLYIYTHIFKLHDTSDASLPEAAVAKKADYSNYYYSNGSHYTNTRMGDIKRRH